MTLANLQFLHSHITTFSDPESSTFSTEKHYEAHSNPHTVSGFLKSVRNSFRSIALFFATLLSVLLSLIAFGAQLATRFYERPTAISCLVNAFAALLFAYVLHITIHTTQSSISHSIRQKSIAAYWILYAPIMYTFGVIFIILHGTSMFQSVTLAADNVAFPAPGVMLPVGGNFTHKLHVKCTGQKQNPTDPIIWFEHGLGGQSNDWTWIQTNVSSYARACSYDHAGFGWSEMGPFPRTTKMITDELKSLLETNGIKDDLIMVGHSMGVSKSDCMAFTDITFIFIFY
jgi:hypothetical protein